MSADVKYLFKPAQQNMPICEVEVGDMSSITSSY